jgi:hypothetical protein
VPITVSEKAKNHIHDHYNVKLINIKDLSEWHQWYQSELHYAPVNKKWIHRLPGGCHIVGIGYSVATINPPNETPVGINLDVWWGEKLGRKPPHKSLSEAKTKEEWALLWKDAPKEERAEWVKMHRRASLDMVMAALEGTPQPLDDDFKGLDPDPTSLDLL